MIIAHKIELRTLLLGRNGFYNDIFKKYYQVFSKYRLYIQYELYNINIYLTIYSYKPYINQLSEGRISFLLLYSSSRDPDIKEKIKNLSVNGDQKELIFYIQNNLIFYYDEDLELYENPVGMKEFLMLNYTKSIIKNMYYNVFLGKSIKINNEIEYMLQKEGDFVYEDVIEEILERIIFPETSMTKCFIL